MPLSEISEAGVKALEEALNDLTQTCPQSPVAVALASQGLSSEETRIQPPSPHIQLPTTPDPSSPVSSASSDSSDDYPALPLASCTIMSNGKTTATMTQVSMKHAPIITAGTLTLQVVQKWVNTCMPYFQKQKVKDEDMVTEVASGLQDKLIQDWYVTNINMLNVLSFTKFVERLHKCWLPQNWEDRTSTALRRMTQCKSESLADWMINLEKQNLLLKNSDLHMSDKELRMHIAANACKDIRRACQKKEYKDIASFKEWKDALAAFDDNCLTDRATRQKEIAAFHVQQGTGHGKHSAPPSRTTSTIMTVSRLPMGCGTSTLNPSSSSTNVNTSNSTDWPQLPLMSVEECDLLCQNNGCFKCQRTFVYHTRKNCPNDPPHACTFRAVTAPDITAIKAKMMTVAAMVMLVGTSALDTLLAHSTLTPSSALIPAVTVDSPPTLPVSNVLESGSGSESKEYVHESIVSPPLLFHGVVHSPSVDVAAMSMLVDMGSLAVLIRDNIVNHLALCRHRLNSPITMNNAWDGGGSAATEWVKLRVSTPSFSWSSVTCCTIIVPSLCAPVSLGLPFLESNHLLFDAQDHSLHDRRTNIDISHPVPYIDYTGTYITSHSMYLEFLTLTMQLVSVLHLSDQ